MQGQMGHFDFKEIFDEDYLYFYEPLLTEERLQREIEFLAQKTNLNEPKHILDLACGHGRHANCLSQMGHKVTGIDSSKTFLNLAKIKARELSAEVDYIDQDMRLIDYENAFDRVNILFTAFGYFEDAENEKLLKKIYRALRPGGFFCFDSYNRDTFLVYFEPNSILERDGNYMIDQRKFDTLSGHCDTKRTIIKDQITKVSNYCVRFYNPTEIKALLVESGFKEVTFYDDFRDEPLSSRSRRMVVIANK